MLDAAAYCEVMQGVYLLFELILPSRNFLTTVMWWQYLQMRYVLFANCFVVVVFQFNSMNILDVATC
jgi:hypothetical protein